MRRFNLIHVSGDYISLNWIETRLTFHSFTLTLRRLEIEKGLERSSKRIQARSKEEWRISLAL